jgi:hypothetical protein
MRDQRITVRVPAVLGTRLRNHSRARGQSPSELVRLALDEYLDKGVVSASAYDLAKSAGLIGCARGAPADLSTNPRHLADFGKSK